MSRVNVANAYETTLNGSITNSATTFSVIDAVPSDLSVPFKCRIVAEGANSDEIITVTAMSGTGNKDWTVSRATEMWNGVQSATAHASGATVQHNFTAGTLLEWTNDPVFNLFGTPDTAFEFDSSSLTGLTLMGSPDTENADTTFASNYFVQDNDSEQVGRYVSVSAPFTSVAKLTEAVIVGNYQYAGLFCGVATPGKLVSVSNVYSGGNAIIIDTWASPSDQSPGVPSTNVTPYVPGTFYPLYFGIKCVSSTDVSYYASRNGKIWYAVLLNHNNSMTVGSTGLTAGAYAGSTIRAAFHYLRVLNSPKKLPAFN